MKKKVLIYTTLILFSFLINFFVLLEARAEESCQCSIKIKGNILLPCDLEKTASFSFGNYTVSKLVEKVAGTQCTNLQAMIKKYDQPINLDKNSCANTDVSGEQFNISYKIKCSVIGTEDAGENEKLGKNGLGENTASSPNPLAGLQKVKDYDQLKISSVPDLIGNLIKTALGVVGSIALAMFVYGGILWMTGSTSVSGGATKKDILKAKSILVWSTLGIIMILSSYIIVNFVMQAFGT